MSLLIRPLRITDIDSLTDIAAISFAAEYEARGQTAASFSQQIRMVTRGRMIPFRLFTRLAGYKWAIFVAEVDGRIVGCGGYIGRKQVELANLMVHPDYRRQGIGRALLQKRLTYLAEAGYPYVTTTVLTTNTASLGNLSQQGFTPFDTYTILQKPLASTENHKWSDASLLSRQLTPTDKSIFTQIEAELTPPDLLAQQGSKVEGYFLSSGQRLLNRLTGSRFWARAFIHKGETVGFLAGRTATGQTSGMVGRPIVRDAHLHHLPAMLHEAETWLLQEDKKKVQLSLPVSRAHVGEELLHQYGWTETYTWVRLIKKLSA